MLHSATTTESQTRNIRCSSLEKRRVVACVVRGKGLSQKVPTLSLVIFTHVLHESVVVLHHMQLKDRCSGAGPRYPGALPGLFELYRLRHLARAWQLHSAINNTRQPLYLQAVGED